MAITRRQFLQRTGTVAAGALLGPGLFENVFVRNAFAATGDRYLVVIFLDGGNDGLNTVVPITNGGGTLRTAYDSLRDSGNGGLNLTPGDLGATQIANDPNTGGQLGLHPGLTGLKQLYDLGKVAVIQGCGYPDYSLSHEQSRVIWQTGNPLGVNALTGTGWMGRYLAYSNDNYGATDIPGVTISDGVAPEYRQYATSVLAVERLQDFGFPYDDFDELDTPAKRQAFADLCAAASGGGQASHVYIGDTGTATLVSSESYPALHSLYHTQRAAFEAQYNALDTSTARRLREIAKVINGVRQGVPNVNARFFQLANTGYDTHSDQGAAETDSQHYLLHREVGDALKVFYDDCVSMGVGSKVTVLIWSEFSRRPEQNDNGTDHGSQGPMFVIGGAVTGGVYGNHPNLDDPDDEGNTKYSQDATNDFRSTDFRDVYGTVLKHWLNMPEGTLPNPAVGTILGSVLQVDSGPAASYWTDPDFDIPFL